jgi:hypothetical protein
VKTADLYAEADAAIRAFRGGDRDRSGAPAHLDIGRARVRFEGGAYEPDDSQPSAILFPIFDGPDPLWSNLYDIVAWRPGDDRMASRMGLAMCLGSVDPLLAMKGPLELYRTPRTWRGDWDGAVIVDWKAAAPYLLGGRTIVAEDVPHALEIEGRLAKLRRRIIPPALVVAIRAS